MRAFNKVHLQAQFLTESLSSFYGIFFVVFMMLGRIFSKIICHSVLQSVAFVSVKTHVWWSRRLGTHNHDRQDFKLFFLAYWSVHYPKFEFRGQSIQWFKQTKASNEKEISLLRISSSAPNASRRVFVDCICASRRAWLSPLQAGCAWSSRVSTGTIVYLQIISIIPLANDTPYNW